LRRAFLEIERTVRDGWRNVFATNDFCSDSVDRFEEILATALFIILTKHFVIAKAFRERKKRLIGFLSFL
jgi:hypothetical protein